MNRYITGIYNYCDAWCKRCAFTHRCRAFAEEPANSALASGADLSDTPAANSDFWEKLAGNLRLAAMTRAAVESVDDLAELPEDSDPTFDAEDDAEADAEMQRLDKLVDEHRLTLLAREYYNSVQQWMKSRDTDAALKQVAQDWMEQAGASMFDKTDYEEQALQVKDYLSVIDWYQLLIIRKMHRVAHGYLEHKLMEKMGNLRPWLDNFSDADGTAKLVLVSIERSMAAWLGLRGFLPGQEDAILPLLALLQRLQNCINVTLPNAASFRRPGFDPGPNIFETDEDDSL